MSEEVNKPSEQNTEGAVSENDVVFDARTVSGNNTVLDEKAVLENNIVLGTAAASENIVSSDTAPNGENGVVSNAAATPENTTLSAETTAIQKAETSVTQNDVVLNTEAASENNAEPDAHAASENNTENNIVFGTVRTEYNEKPFPINMLQWNVEEDFKNVSPPNFDLIVSQEVLVEVNRHVSETLNRELGGFLLGNRYYCPIRKRDYIQIDNYSEARFSSSDEVSLKLTHETWQQLQADLDGKNRGKQLIGWYHSHPKMSVFLSPMDVKVHTEHFSNKYAVALVIEPEKMTGGFFCWRWNSVTDPFADEKTLHQNARMNFYELKGINSDETCMPWSSEYSCVDCETGASVRPQLSKKHFATSKSSDTSLIQVPAPKPVVKSKTEEPVILEEQKTKWLVPAVAALFGIIVLSSLGYLGYKYLLADSGDEVASQNTNRSNTPATPATPQKEQDSPNKTISDTVSSKRIFDDYTPDFTQKPYYLVLTATDENFNEKYEVALDDQKLNPVDKNKIKKGINNSSKNNPKIVYYEIPSDLPKLGDAKPNKTVFFTLKIKNRSDESIEYEDNNFKGTIGTAVKTNSNDALQKKRQETAQQVTGKPKVGSTRPTPIKTNTRPQATTFGGDGKVKP